MRHDRPGRRALACGGCALLLVMAGCARPQEVPGTAGPVTRAATGTATPTPTSSRPAPAPSGTPVPPAEFSTYRLDRLGLAVELPVPAGWSRRTTGRGVEFGDPTGTTLLRVEIVPRSAATARESWEEAEKGFRVDLEDYRRLGLVDVPGPVDTADLTFTFVRDEVARRAIDRGYAVDGLSLAVYYAAPRDLYDRMLPVFERATRDLRLN